jgi:hypothetical protein
MKSTLAIGMLVLAGCTQTTFETLDVEMGAIPENPADPEWRAIFQKGANERCGGRAEVANESLVFTAPIDGQPAKMSGRYRCK